MREVVFDLSSDETVSRYCFAGFEGEHNATCLVAMLPHRMILEGAEYRFLFETAKGEAVFSVPVIPKEGTVSVFLTRALMIAPRLKAYVGCYCKEGGETRLIEKSAEMVLGIQKSVAEGSEMDLGVGDLPGLVLEDSVLEGSENPVKSNALYRAFAGKVGKGDLSQSIPSDGNAKKDRAVSEKAVAAALEKHWSKEELSIAGAFSQDEKMPVQGGVVFRALQDKVGKDELSQTVPEKEQASVNCAVSEKAVAVALEPYLKKEEYGADERVRAENVANALKGKKSGNPITLFDVSPLEHDIKVKLVGLPTNKNLFHFINGYKSEGVYNEDSEEESIIGNPWSYEAKKDTSRIIVNNPSGASGAGYPQTIEFDLTELIDSLDQNEHYTISADIYGEFTFYGLSFDGEHYLIDDESLGEAPYTFKPSELSNKKMILYLQHGEGEILIQLEKGNSATDYEDYGTVKDVNGATVQKYGKNLFNAPDIKKGYGGDTTAEGDIITTTLKNAAVSITSKKVFRAGKYTISVFPETSGMNCSVYIYDAKDEVTNIVSPRYFENITERASWKFEAKKDFVFAIGSYKGKYGTFSYKILLEVGESPSAFESYKNPELITADGNGNLSIIGNGESMTLIAENGVTMEAEYNRDINKAFAELYEAVNGGSANV